MNKKRVGLNIKPRSPQILYIVFLNTPKNQIPLSPYSLGAFTLSIFTKDKYMNLNIPKEGKGMAKLGKHEIEKGESRVTINWKGCHSPEVCPQHGRG